MYFLSHFIERPGNKQSGKILLYTFVISDGFQLCVYSALSEDHSANFLSFWMSEFLKTYGRIPKIFVCDMSFALINAAVRTFGQNSSITEYLDLIFHMIQRKNIPISISRPHIALIRLPPCIVRIDFAHLMNLISKNKALNTPNTLKKVKDFYMRCVAILIQTKDIDRARSQILSVLIVAKSKTEGNSENGDEVPCEIHKKIIVNTIINGIDESMYTSEHQETETEPVESADDINEEIEYLENLSSSFTTWLNDIVKSADETVAYSDEGNRDNVMYKPLFAKDFIRLCKILPLWSGISCDLFGIDEITSSSSNVESDYKNIKQSLAEIIPCSVDVFVPEHMELVIGASIEASQQQGYVKFIGIQNEKKAMNTDDEMESENSANELHTGRKHISSSESDQSDTTRSRSVSPNESDGIERKNSIEESPNPSIHYSIGCQSGGEPGGAHRCIECNKAVHILSCCSVSIGDEEGYGERRLCNACANAKKTLKPSSRSKNVRASQAISEMKYKEEWEKSQKKTTSKYMRPAPNWNLSNNIKKKVKLGILKNAIRSKTKYKVGKKSVTLLNTCAFDAICQVKVLKYFFFVYM